MTSVRQARPRIIERVARRLVPSVPVLSHRRGLMRVVDAIDRVASAPFPEFRGLPPNHLRIRVGVGNRMFFNQPYYLGLGSAYLVELLAGGYLELDSYVVDIGCGCGRLAHALRRAGFSGTYVGVDVDPEQIAWCQAHFDEPAYRFSHADVFSKVYNPEGSRAPYRLPVPDGTAGAVLGHSLFTHLLEQDMHSYIVESRRVLRAGGVMFMGVFSREHLRDSAALGTRWTFEHSLGNAFVESLDYPEAAVAYGTQYLLDACAEAGFASSEVQPAASQSILVARA